MQAGLTPQLLVQGSPRGHRQRLDELRELNPPVLAGERGVGVASVSAGPPGQAKPWAGGDGQQQAPDTHVERAGAKE